MTQRRTPTGMDPKVDPRVERTRAVVLGAARDMLAELGYAGVSIEALVARTGVAKTTVYRHWPSRTELLHDALSSTKPSTPPRDTGDLAADLNALLRGVVYATGRDVYLRSMPSLVDAAQHDPDLQALHDRLAEERSRGLRELLTRARDRGDLRDGCDIEILAHTLIGFVFVRRIFRGLPVSDRDVSDLVDMVLHGAAPSAYGRVPDSGPRA